MTFNCNRRFTRNEACHALYLLMLYRFFDNRVNKICHGLYNFTTYFCGNFRNTTFILYVPFSNVRRIKGRINTPLMLYFCVTPDHECNFIFFRRIIVKATIRRRRTNRYSNYDRPFRYFRYYSGCKLLFVFWFCS